MSDFFAVVDHPKHATPAAPAPIIRGDATTYARAALESECDNVRRVAIGSGRNAQLNTSAVKMGGLVAAGVISEAEVTSALGEADGGLDYPATRRTIASGLSYGMQHARDIPDRSASSDPYSDDYDGSGTLATTLRGTGRTATTASPAESGDVVGIGTPADRVRERFPRVDWTALFTSEPENDWIIEPILPARRLVAIYSAPKVGKSLLVVELAYHLAKGTPVLGYTLTRPYKVLYVDFENDLYGDVRPRLESLGALPWELDNLAYLSLPSLSGLDTERGAAELLAAIKTYESEIVVVDTLSRSVDGDENENDTWLRFYRYTGLALKQAGVSMIRLDHSGKDDSKGMRGGSAKEGDLDAVWHLSKVTDETLRLVCTHHRFYLPAADKILTLERQDEPLRHVVNPRGSGETVREALIAWMDDTDVPLDAGFRAVLPVVRESGINDGRISRERLLQAMETRRMRAGWTGATDEED